jgi:hypothetical protein
MSIQLSNKYSTTLPSHIYYDVSALNNSGNSPALPVVLNYLEVRNNPYLPCPENYYMSIVRFDIQTPTLPVFIPSIATGTDNTLNDVNQTVYNITMNYAYLGTVYTFSAPIMYRRFDFTLSGQAPTSVASLNTTALTSPYYYIYSYQNWVSMVNACFTSCYNGLSAIIVALGGALPSAYAPFMEFDPINQVAFINADLAGYLTDDLGVSLTTIGVFFNTPLATLYNNFPMRQFAFNSPLGYDSKLIFQNISYLNTLTITVNPAVPTTYTAIQITQEGQTTALLNPIESVIFTSSLLPVVPEQVGVPKLFNIDVPSSFSAGNNSNIAPIITDFEIPWSAFNTYKPSLSYTPTAEYRMIDLVGSSPVSGIDIQCFWKDRYGINHPFLLGSGCSANLKIMFRLKDYYSQSRY